MQNEGNVELFMAAPPQEQGLQPSWVEEVKLSVRLSLGGRFAMPAALGEVPHSDSWDDVVPFDWRPPAPCSASPRTSAGRKCTSHSPGDRHHQPHRRGRGQARDALCQRVASLWPQNEDSKEISNECYSCLLEEFNIFKQLVNENAESMYSHLKVLVNEINALGVKNITDLNINCKILQSLRRPDYDLVKAIIYKKKLEKLKPSHILSKIMAHELQIMPKSRKAA
jgi:hypothetical protein